MEIEKKKLVSFTMSGIISFLSAFGFSVASLSFSNKISTADCDSDLNWHTWLEVIGGTSLAYALSLFIIVFGVIIFAFSMTCSIERALTTIYGLLHIISLVYYSFVLWWIIFTGNFLFRSRTECKNEILPLWIVSIIMFIINYIHMCAIFYVTLLSKKSENINDNMLNTNI